VGGWLRWLTAVGRDGECLCDGRANSLWREEYSGKSSDIRAGRTVRRGRGIDVYYSDPADFTVSGRNVLQVHVYTSGPKVVAARRIHGTIQALSSYILLPPSIPPLPGLKEIRRRKHSSHATPRKARCAQPPHRHLCKTSAGQVRGTPPQSARFRCRRFCKPRTRSRTTIATSRDSCTSRVARRPIPSATSIKTTLFFPSSSHGERLKVAYGIVLVIALVVQGAKMCLWAQTKGCHIFRLCKSGKVYGLEFLSNDGRISAYEKYARNEGVSEGFCVRYSASTGCGRSQDVASRK
jgi:hypothetical protein